MTNLEKLRFLLTMATADGSISSQELQLFAHRAMEWGITDDEFENILDEAVKNVTPLPEIPKDAETRSGLLRELVYMMAADGQMHSTERQLFAVIAAQMDVTEAELNGIIDAAIADRS